jgi:DNA-directed RNA polymerase subunit E'/Rpb7
MIYTVTVNEKIVVESCLLNKDLINNIMAKLNRKTPITVNDIHGFVKNVSDLKIVQAEVSSADSNNVFKIVYTAQIIKPLIGDKFDLSKIVHYDDNRLFVEIDDLFDAVIVNVNKINNFYTFKDCSCQIPIHTNLLKNIILTKVVCLKNRFIIIGEHSH